MKTSLLFLSLTVATVLSAQTKHTITASGMTFTPNSLTINQGDTVEWDNVSGFHNVNGTQATFPANPTSFGNSPASAPWNYTFVFTVAGNYAYQCDVHAPNMAGTIVVQPATSVVKLQEKTELKVFPNPTADYFSIDTKQTIKSVSLINITGQLVKTYTETASQTNRFDVKALPKGIYFINIEIGDAKLVEKLIIQ
ncbi:MAG: T9SS type A sorting domain-containing protein [Flavobacteriales bacterium]|nr:T9SS type A sorting domain-containing protein [Flavobacteriales bacterium]MCW8913993.1 T9SS type A sorting domain-containing protein [Flavobacteriales bacterium]MCW8937732.1 T9SS type A sorting domain-containing protein [Flavobacteriales bacterium]MCW8939200.1 T9SS type A sorting domain-containing protein [Flavobacteriales bacterium]MCW8967913.1 T9SS type A sorting domain-containing protein [Flavobacteriales bacterium]